MRQIRSNFAFAFLLGLVILITYLYQSTTIPNAKELFKSSTDELKINSPVTTFKLDLHQDSYLLRTKHVIQKDGSKETRFNGKPLNAYIYAYKKKKGIIETDYFYLPQEIVKEGRNIIEIYFSKNQPKDIDIIVTNYRKKIGDGIFVLFRDSSYTTAGTKHPLEGFYLPIFLFIILFAAVVLLLGKIFSFSVDRFFLIQAYSLVPLFLVLLILEIISHLGNFYKIIISHGYFWRLALVSFILTEICIFLAGIFKRHNSKTKSTTNSKELSREIERITEKYKSSLRYINMSKVKSVRNFIGFCIKVRFLFGKSIFLVKTFILFNTANRLIIFAIVLLVACALLLILNLDMIAEQVGNVAYFVLVAGITIKLVRFIKSKGSNW